VTPLVLQVESEEGRGYSRTRAMTPHVALAACVSPSRNKGNEDKKNENLQGRLLRRIPSRAMTSQTMSAACVYPWRRSAARPGTVLDSPDSIPGRPQQQRPRGGALREKCEHPPGDSGTETAPATTRKQQQLPGRKLRGAGGETWSLRARRHATTVAFELLRRICQDVNVQPPGVGTS